MDYIEKVNNDVLENAIKVNNDFKTNSLIDVVNRNQILCEVLYKLLTLFSADCTQLIKESNNEDYKMITYTNEGKIKAH